MGTEQLIPSLPRAPVPMSEADVVAALFDKLQEIGPEPEALPICDKILEQCPADPDVLRCKCVCLVHDNRFEEALTFIDGCGAGAALVFERAYCLYKCKRYEECLKIAKLPEHSANDAFRQLQAQIQNRSGQYAEAATLFEALEASEGDQEPQELKTNSFAAGVHSHDGAGAEAVDTESYDCTFNHACHLLAGGRYEEATTQLHSAIAQAEETLIGDGWSAEQVVDECAAIKVQLGYIHQKQHQTEEAMALYQEILKEKPSDVQFVTVAQNNVIALRKHTDLFDSFKKAKSAITDDVEDKLTLEQKRAVQLNHALLLLYMNKTDSSREHLAAYEKRWGCDQHTSLLRSAILWREKKTAKAEEILAEYSKQHNHTEAARVILSLAQLQIGEGHLTAAIETLRLANTMQYRLGMVATLMSLHEQAGDMQGAADVLAQAYNHGDSAHQEALLRQTARFHTRHHNHEQAAAAYEKLIAMDSNDVQAVAGLVQSCAQFDSTRAEKYAEQIPELEAAEAIEIAMVDQTAGPSRRRGEDLDPTAAAANDAAAAIQLRKKQALKQKRLRSLHKRLPKALDANVPSNWPAIDAERWLPKRDRSYYRPRRGQRKNQGKYGGSQGAVSEHDRKLYDRSASTVEAAAASPEPESPTKAPPKNPQNHKQNDGKKKKKK